MAVLHRIRSMARNLFAREHVERDLDAEVRGYSAMLEEENMARGMKREEAQKAARIELGGMEELKDHVRSVRKGAWIEMLLQDLRFGARMLRRNPGFTFVAVLTLGLGIGANTAVFSVVYAAILRPLPYSQPERLFALAEARGAYRLDAQNTSYPDLQDWATQSGDFQSFAAFTSAAFTLTLNGRQEFVRSTQVTSNFFSTLGVKPMLGRDFYSGEEDRDGPHVAILGYGYWKSEFGGDAGIIGRSLQLNNQAVTCVGVLPPQFEFALRPVNTIWTPIVPAGDLGTRRNLRWLRVIGRLAPKFTPSQAQAEMEGITRRLAAAYPQADGNVVLVMRPLRERIVGQIRPLLLILFGAVGFVLFIACANVANLTLARAAWRRSEFAVRASLGASRLVLASQVLTECVLLSLLGGALGLVLANWGTEALIDAIPKDQLASMPYLQDAHPSAAVMLFLFSVATLTGIVFGTVPALRVSRSSASEALRRDSRWSRGNNRLHDTIVVAEIAFSLILLVGAGLMARSLAAMLRRDPGFDPRNLLTFALNLPNNNYSDAARRTFEKLSTQRIKALPDVQDVTIGGLLPMTGASSTFRFVFEGHPVQVGQEDECQSGGASSSFFPVLKIPLIRGRWFNDLDDSAASPLHLVVNQAFVNRFMSTEDPIGKRLRFTLAPTETYREIVGVVGDTASNLDEPAPPIMYTPFDQGRDSYPVFAVRTFSDPLQVLESIRTELRQLDPQLALIQPATMDEIRSTSSAVFLRRYPSFLIGSFAVLALILATVGLYGLISYSVTQRRRELGIRMAIGAQPSQVLRMVLARGIRLGIVGIAIGLVGSLTLTRLMRSFLYGVTNEDPITFASVAVLMFMVALSASMIPARRASRLNPLSILRDD